MAEIDQKAVEGPPAQPKRKPDLEKPSPDPKKSKLQDSEAIPISSQPNSDLQQVNHCSAELGEESVDGEGNAASNGEQVIDEGKAMIKEVVDKGKGILEEVEESSSSGSDDDGESEGYGEDEDGDFVDDPLAEVDLSNILPSRTRRRGVVPGEYIVNDMDEDEDDDDDEDVGEGVDEENDDDEDSD